MKYDKLAGGNHLFRTQSCMQRKNKEEINKKKFSTFCFLFSANQSGFSVLEVMIAIFLLVLGMMAAISLLTSGLSNSTDSRNQTIAGLLSQEGAELVRNIRDTNWVTRKATFSGINAGNDCTISPGTALSCGSGGPFQLYYNVATLRYAHILTPAPTKFSRKIIIEDLPNNEKKVTSEVVWGGAWPASVAACSAKSKCAYSEVMLTEWGQN
jgi:hypothetical protein